MAQRSWLKVNRNTPGVGAPAPEPAPRRPSTSGAASTVMGICAPGRFSPGLLRPLRCVIANLSAFAACRKESAAAAGTVSSSVVEEEAAANESAFRRFS